MELYHRNTGAQTTTPGLSLVHKLTYEHIHLTSFSKMQVDLAVQVCYIYILQLHYIFVFYPGFKQFSVESN